MNALLLNRDGFVMPADGWYQVAPLGEFGHAQAGVVQVVDREACEAMANRFAEEAKAANFAGLLVDFDHFSLDGEKRSEAAGWVVALEARGPVGSGQLAVGREEPTPGPSEEGSLRNGGSGLWAKIRWSDVGEEAVKGGRYRFLSPVWARGDCVDLGNGRVRPVRLLNAAVTNDPNLKGMRPLSNSGRVSGQLAVDSGQAPSPLPSPARGEGVGLANAGGEAARFKWVLGTSPGDRHCPSCAAAAGHVHTMAEWEAGGVKPGGGGLFCRGNCHCSLEPTDDPSSGAVTDKVVRIQKSEARSQKAGGNGKMENRMAEPPMDDECALLANIGWTDAARAASIAVRRAKAASRKAAGGAGGKGGGKESQKPDYVGMFEAGGLSSMAPEAVEELTDQIRIKMVNGKSLSPAEERFLDELTASGFAGLSERDPIFVWQEKRAAKQLQGDDTAGLKNREVECGAHFTAGRAVERGAHFTAGRCGGAVEGDEVDVVFLVNTGWTDEARIAAMAVRRARDAGRGKTAVPPAAKAADDGRMYAGGSPYFDETLGRYVYPPAPPGPPVVVTPGPPGTKPGIPGWRPPPGLPRRRIPAPVDPPGPRIPPVPPRRLPIPRRPWKA